jgi:O-antigen/teichoic acid export membrane protein
MTHPPGDQRNPQRRFPGFARHVRTHGSALALVGLASIIGALAAFAFQILTARYLGPADFGLLSAFFAIVNVAAIGSSSVQNSVTVETAAALSAQVPSSRRSKWPVEALAIGLGGGVVVAVLAPVLADSLDTTVPVVLAAAFSIPLSFLFADSLGLIQGTGNASGAVWWSTASLVGRVLFVLAAMAVGWGLGGVVGGVTAATAAAVVGAWLTARRIPRPPRGVFSVSGLTVVVLTVAFAWLTNADVFLLRSTAPATVAGTYASAAVLVKAAFLLPSTLSLYLLPRFVRNIDQPGLTRAGVIATLGLSTAGGLAMIVVFAVAGAPIMSLLYGSAYQDGGALLVPVAIAYLPWIMAQGMLIRITAIASKAAAVLLVLSVAVQWLAFTLVLPNVVAMLTAFGLLGVVVLIAFLVFDWLTSKRSRDVRIKEKGA